MTKSQISDGTTSFRWETVGKQRGTTGYKNENGTKLFQLDEQLEIGVQNITHNWSRTKIRGRRGQINTQPEMEQKVLGKKTVKILEIRGCKIVEKQKSRKYTAG